MEIKPLKIGNLCARLPLIQGGMGVGVSLGGLAGAVAKEGGIGIISTAQIGFREPDFDENPIGANMRAIEKEFIKAKNIAPQGIIGFNIMVATRYYEEYVRRAVQCGADVIISGAGLPVKLPEYVEGSDTKIAPIVSSRKAASVICRMWDRKYGSVPDFIVIEGPMAGGHLGFHQEEAVSYAQEALKQKKDCGSGKGFPKGYDREIMEIREEVRIYEEKYRKKIPVIVAGGVFDSRDVEYCLKELGADGVQAATRFVTTEECDAPQSYKQAYLDAEVEDIVIVKSPVGMPGRAIRNQFLRQVEEGTVLRPSKCHQCLEKCSPAEIPYCITEALVNAVTGKVDQALLFCGANAYRCRKIQTVKQVVEDMFGGPGLSQSGI